MDTAQNNNAYALQEVDMSDNLMQVLALEFYKAQFSMQDNASKRAGRHACSPLCMCMSAP
eukprot:1159085-Pelagomonas_calceolata.AAC.12